MEGPQRKFKRELPYDPEVPLQGVYLKETNSLSWKDIYTPMFIATLFAIAKIGKRPVLINR